MTSNLVCAYQKHEATDEQRDIEEQGVHRGNLQLGEGCRHRTERKMICKNITQKNKHHSTQMVEDIMYSTTIIEKIKKMPRSLFLDIPCYVTMGYEKLN